MGPCACLLPRLLLGAAAGRHSAAPLQLLLAPRLAHAPAAARHPCPAGDWDVALAPELEWTEGDKWQIAVQLPQGELGVAAAAAAAVAAAVGLASNCKPRRTCSVAPVPQPASLSQPSVTSTPAHPPF